MDTKEELVAKLKNWIQLDNDIRALRAQCREKLSAQKMISQELLEIMKSNEIDTLNTSELNISCAQKEVRTSLSKKYLENVLLEYFDNNSQKASEMQEFIMSRRTCTTKDYLKTKRL
jgi:hypothetical protein